MKNNRTTWIIFKRVISILFIIFIILYFQVETGINPGIKQKTIITQENIEQFENDIKNGEYIDIKDYVETNKVDTSNIISDAGYIISERTSNFFGKELVEFFKYIGKLVN